MSERIKRRTSERGSDRPTGRYSDRSSVSTSVAPTVAESRDRDRDRRSTGRYSDFVQSACGQVSNRLPPSLRSVAFENPCRIHASLTHRPESMKKPQTARAEGGAA